MLTFTGNVPKTSKNHQHTISMRIEDFDQSEGSKDNPSQSLSRVRFNIKIKFLTRNNQSSEDCEDRPKLIWSPSEGQCQYSKRGEKLKMRFGVKGHTNDPMYVL